jgi:hypothetical protein
MKASDFRSHKVFGLCIPCFIADYKHGFEIRAIFKESRQVVRHLKSISLPLHLLGDRSRSFCALALSSRSRSLPFFGYRRPKVEHVTFRYSR